MTGENTAPLGRSNELAVLHDALDRATAGTGATLVVEGEAGIGKSCLLAATVGRARSAGHLAIEGATDEYEVGRPFGTVIDAFLQRGKAAEPELSDLAALLGGDAPRAAGADLEPLRYQVVDAVVDGVERLTRRGPVLLAFDDLQWADPATLLTLGSLARRIRTLPVLMLWGTRPYDPSSPLGAQVNRVVADGQRRMQLAPLSTDSAVEIAVELLGGRPDRRLREQLERVGGNPFFLTQLVVSFQEEGQVELTDEGEAVYHGSSMPRRVLETVGLRVGRLGSRAQQVLRVASVVGPRIDVRTLAHAMGEPVSALVEPLEELLTAAMISDNGSTIAFRHDLIREAVYSAIPTAARLVAHGEVADALAAGGAPSIEVVEHLFEVAAPGDTRAAEWARRAAAEMLPLDADAAVAVLDRALEVCADDRSCTEAIEADRIRALSWAGRFDETEQALLQAIGRAESPEDQPRLHLSRARVLFEQGRWRELIGTLEPLVSQGSVDGIVADRVRAAIGAAYGALHEAESAMDCANEVLERQGVDGDPIARTEALITMTWASIGRTSTAETIEYARAAVREAQRDGTWEAFRRHPHIALAFSLATTGRSEDALDALAAGRKTAQRLISSWDDSAYHSVACLIHTRLGSWDDARAEIDAGLERCVQTGSKAAVASLRGCDLLIAVHRGEFDRADHALAEARAATGDLHSMGTPVLWRAWALLLEARNEPEAALAMLVESWNLRSRETWINAGPHLIRVARRTGDESWAARVVEEIAAWADTAGTVWVRAYERRCFGLAGHDPEPLLEAARLFEGLGQAPDVAACRLDAAQLLARSDRRAARAVIDDAIALYESLDAHATLALAQTVVQSLKTPARGRAREARPTTGWASLTRSEVRVARLVAEGMTNAEVGAELFISPRTVESHLGRAFTKLEVKSRVELALLALRQSDEGEGG